MTHESKYWREPTILIASLVITLLVFVARMVARCGIAKNAGLDDVLVSIGMLPLIGLSILTILGGTSDSSSWQWLIYSQGIGGYGSQFGPNDFTPHIMQEVAKIKFAIIINYVAASAMIKLSILCFYRRFSGPLTYIWSYSDTLSAADANLLNCWSLGWFWTAIEDQLGVFWASAPAMKIFFNHYFETYTPCTIGSFEIFQRVKMRFLDSTQPRPSVQQNEEIAAR
ncbi:predicted protein [Pyrenophora tritici-repentis Pt-1C-BFP]|uniref:Rhodopsin domain-containing protein n=1 Tax=Pyrenophora tritici-repentis (strain Pt-1C-BFP) TaxID=426418 RepID=B2WKQ3_PYRTR|nr:uncharacterized protein PTRG_10563 [Pyrenophora tritici-repentis Pt-1C-BFP]EDU43613.1 predicted protein [Pyrenophora tritici-repentis Pt-1C-BFP]